MNTSPGPRAPHDGKRRFVSTGTLLVLGFAAVIGLGLVAYQRYIPPVWLHDFGADIALRAEADPTAKVPEDMRQASPRHLAESPYICAAKVANIPWDQMFVVTASQDLRTHPVLSQAKWPHHNFADMADELSRDQRYQLVVLVKDNAVADAQLFYTFWANLDAIARPEGFNRETAVFTAASRGGVYVVAPAENAPANVCG
ncbi:MAG: hypothetical protein K2P94_06295 [Rhodospirillaceae bacterium]|nr:hypothetical protein [Rhodospirillaceae bacterium]